MSSWGKRGERPAEPGEYEVERENGSRERLTITKESRLIVSLLNGPQCRDLDSSCWNGACWFRIPDPPFEIPDGKFFVCNHIDSDEGRVVGVRNGNKLEIKFRGGDVALVSLVRANEFLSEVIVLPEAYQ